MTTQNVKPLADEFVEQAANMVATAEDSVKSLAFFSATLPESEVTRITERVASIKSAKSYAAMRDSNKSNLTKDAAEKDVIAAHEQIETLAALLVSITDVKENRVGGGKSLEHVLHKVQTPSGLVKVVVKTGDAE